ncbi:MAG: GTP cyclohydrolase I FolE2 [Phenylobacterium sp.]|uniref:GTP cyclohydrolase FolE2 n=1 Tax=Phenylobacterium sp. TaxID=1871053 RepID=UPI00120B70DA|nr:GTP cyclohydrolase FolE2 [Phenylobacterium sp.]TAL30235.1 MAG: GTP cyclohydrolase I FolE2 [Phenylobacterium sp.]
MNAFAPTDLPDVQASADRRGQPIQRVGVRGVTHPVALLTGQGPCPTVAEVEMYVALPAEQKGTHMSRFVALLQDLRQPLDSASLPALMDEMLDLLDADGGYLSFSAPIFLTKQAPVSGISSLMDYRARLIAEHVDGRTTVSLSVTAPVTSLCPCSKTISRYGAHNQRSHITITASLAQGVRMLPDDLIRIAEDAASCELWGLLKRADEKYVTERAYENPKFVEDLVRDVATRLSDDPRVSRYEVSSENFESIHNHSAYAWMEGAGAA